MRSSLNKSRAWLGILAIVATVAAAVLVPATAAAANIASEPTPAPSHHHTLAMGTYHAGAYAGEAAHLPSSLTTALERDLNVSPEQYLADAAAASQAVKVVASLKSAGVHVLGSKIQDTSLTINVRSSADTAAIIAAGATPIVGAPAKVDLSHRHFTSDVATTGTYGGQGYIFQGTDGGEYRCSIGFSGYSSGAVAQFATAGHCATIISGNATLLTQSAPTPAGSSANVTAGNIPLGATVSGEAAYGNYTYTDYGIVGEGSSVIPQANIYTWGGGAGAPLSSAALPVQGQTAGIVGANLCKSGSTSGWTCGTIRAVDASVEVCEQGITDCPSDTINSIVATTCLLPGDSGGAAVIGQNAAGIDSGSDFPSNSCANPNLGNTAMEYESVFFPMVTTGTGSNVAGKSVTGQVGSAWMLLASPVVTAPAVGATVYSSTSMSGTLFNPQSTAQVALYLDGSATAYSTVSVSSGTWSIPLAGVGGGPHSYSLNELVGGNQVAVVTGSFTIAVPPAPTVNALPACQPLTATSTLSGTAPRAVSTTTVSLTLDGASTPFATVPASSGTWSIPLSGLANGNHEYTVTASPGGGAVSPAVAGVLTMTNPSGSGPQDSSEVAVYRFYSPAYNDHFYTMSQSECQLIQKQWQNIWSYEGVAYNGFKANSDGSAPAGTVPLYRFWSPVYNGHFFTSSETESLHVQATYPTIWSYEGIDFYVYPEDLTTVSNSPSPSATLQVARFWSSATGQHFYSVDPIEIAYIETHYPPNIWAFEQYDFRVPAS